MTSVFIFFGLCVMLFCVLFYKKKYKDLRRSYINLKSKYELQSGFVLELQHALEEETRAHTTSKKRHNLVLENILLNYDKELNDAYNNLTMALTH